MELIERAGRILADAAASPAKVLVFGSHARGEAKDGSDLDFLVIEREVVNRAHEMVRLRDALPALGGRRDRRERSTSRQVVAGEGNDGPHGA